MVVKVLVFKNEIVGFAMILAQIFFFLKKIQLVVRWGY